jgi:uncharacterized protein (UPF0332 family)
VKDLTPLEKCFADRNLEIVAPSREKYERSILQARVLLQEAKNAMGSDSPILAMSGIYFAMFHAARAVLFHDGIREKSHFCAERYLETYVSSGKIGKNWITLFGRMRERREKNQYDFSAPASPEEIEGSWELARDFIRVIEEIFTIP